MIQIHHGYTKDPMLNVNGRSTYVEYRLAVYCIFLYIVFLYCYNIIHTPVVQRAAHVTSPYSSVTVCRFVTPFCDLEHMNCNASSTRKKIQG
jgi:hypothetical protein